MTVRYHQTKNGEVPTYLCQRAGIETAQPICTALPGQTLDQAIGALLIETLTPLSIEAAFTVTAELRHRSEQADALRAGHVQRARYHAETARRRYLAVDPTHRLVAETLEADWNTALRALGDAQQAYDKARAAGLDQLSDTQKTRIQQLSGDLPAIWNDPATPARERKRIARLLLSDVTVSRTGDTITAHVRLAGGRHHTLTVPVPKKSWELRQTSPDVVTEIDRLLDQHTTGEIADILNAAGHTSGTGQPFHHKIIDNIIHDYRLHTRRRRLREQGLRTLAETAQTLGVQAHTVKAWRRAGIVSAQRYNDKGEYLYHPIDPENPPERPTIGRPPRP
jgi:DNA-binding CsgD family transcriptional regulator